MSVLWMDDPSFYTTQFTTRYTVLNVSGTFGVSAGNGRFGTASWRFTGSIQNAQPSYAKTPGFGNIATGTVAISMKMTALPGNTVRLFRLWDSGNEQLYLAMNASGNLQVWRGNGASSDAAGTALGSASSNSLGIGIWYRIELQATIATGTGGNIEVRVNGTSTGWVPSTGSLNTRATLNSSFNAASFGTSSTGLSTSWSSVDYNDFVVTDSNSPNAGFLGDKRCFLRLPNANSAVAWTPNTGTNWQCVDDNPPDDDTTYNSDQTPGDKDLFTLPTLPALSTGIVAVDNIIYARKDDAGPRTVAPTIKSGATSQDGSTFGLSTIYQFFDQVQDQDPNAGPGAWTQSAANALLVGYKEVA